MNEGKKTIFYSAFNRRVCCPAPCGSAFKKERQIKYDSDGNRYLAVVGEINLSDFINSFADEVDINKLVARCQLTGDYSLLNRTQGFFGDFSGIPTHVTELRSILARSEAVFASLPADVKSVYGSSDAFVRAISSEDGVCDLSKHLNDYYSRKVVNVDESPAC